MSVSYTGNDKCNTYGCIPESEMHLRPPREADGKAVWTLVRRSGGLDLNSPYAYLMACRNWTDTCVVAENASGLTGVVIAYRLTEHPDVLFVWQVGVDPDYRGWGLARSMLVWLISNNAPLWLETSVTPSNTASRALFSSLARDLKTGIVVSPWLAATDFPDSHEGEDLFRIGPFPIHKECDHENI